MNERPQIVMPNIMTTYFIRREVFNNCDFNEIRANPLKLAVVADYVFKNTKCVKSRDGHMRKTKRTKLLNSFEGIIFSMKDSSRKTCDCKYHPHQVCDVCQNVRNKPMKDKK